MRSKNKRKLVAFVFVICVSMMTYYSFTTFQFVIDSPNIVQFSPPSEENGSGEKEIKKEVEQKMKRKMKELLKDTTPYYYNDRNQYVEDETKWIELVFFERKNSRIVPFGVGQITFRKKKGKDKSCGLGGLATTFKKKITRFKAVLGCSMERRQISWDKKYTITFLNGRKTKDITFETPTKKDMEPKNVHRIPILVKFEDEESLQNQSNKYYTWEIEIDDLSLDSEQGSNNAIRRYIRYQNNGEVDFARIKSKGEWSFQLRSKSKDYFPGGDVTVVKSYSGDTTWSQLLFLLEGVDRKRINFIDDQDIKRFRGKYIKKSIRVKQLLDERFFRKGFTHRVLIYRKNSKYPFGKLVYYSVEIEPGDKKVQIRLPEGKYRLSLLRFNREKDKKKEVLVTKKYVWPPGND